MKLPGPDHPITIDPTQARMRAQVGDHVIADTTDALVMHEKGHDAVQYFPREAVEMGFLTKTAKTSYCPYKGDCSYYSIAIDGQVLENVVWSYEEPYPAMEAIRERLAFYPNHVKIYAVDEAAMARHEHVEA